MELRQYGQVLRRRWLVVLIPTLLAALVMAAVALIGPTSYQSTTTMFYTPSDAASAAGLEAQRMQTYVTLVQTPRAASAVIAGLHLPLRVSQVQGSLSATASADTLLLDVTATSTSAPLSPRLSSAAAAWLITVAADLEPRVATTTRTTPASVAPLTVTQSATAAVSTRASTAARDILLGLVLGLLVGVIAALVLDSVQDLVTSERQMQGDHKLPTLASIPLDPAQGAVPALMYDQGGPLAEAFRRLRTRLMPVGQSGPRTIVVTSPLPGAGTTTVTCALGMALARGGARVVIVGADLHHPELDALVPVGPGAGLTEVLEHAEALDDALQPFGDGRLTVLPSGAAVSSPGDLLGSDTMALLVGNLQARFDRVLIEAPPVLPYADAVILAGATEAGVVLVVQHGKTRRQELGEAVGLLRESGVSILGLVLNMTPVAGQPTPATSRPASWWARARAVLLPPTEAGHPQDASDLRQDPDHDHGSGSGWDHRPGAGQEMPQAPTTGKADAIAAWTRPPAAAARQPQGSDDVTPRVIQLPADDSASVSADDR